MRLKKRLARVCGSFVWAFLFGWLSTALVFLGCYFGFFLCAAPLFAQARQGNDSYARMATEERIKGAGWWPTKGAAARSEYVGAETCIGCHRERTAHQTGTSMGHASAHAVDSEILRQRAPLKFHSENYSFQIARAGEKINYSVSDGKNSHSQTLDWAFGFGDVGQTYVYEKEGTYYESRLSFFPSLQALDLTLGHNAPPPDNLAAALGRPMAAPEARQCFGCHTTASNIAGRLEPSHLIPGVSCEACHGPGLRHALAMREGQQEFAAQTIFNPARLEPQEYLDFCGACHRTAADVAMADLKGRITVRFQPYRLEQSRCWGADGDARLTCRACHDPHQPLVRDTASYDGRCLACHPSTAATDAAHGSSSATNSAGTAAISTSASDNGSAGADDHSPRACPVAKKGCASCHMPKIDLPGAHAQFTDHRIRIVKSE